MSAALRVPTTIPEAFLDRVHAVSPARVEAADLRVELVLDLMAHGHWRAHTHRELASLWGIGPEAVRAYSTAASKVLKLQFSPERNEEIRSVVLARLWTLGDEARNRTEEVVDVKGEVHEVRRPDMRTALASVVAFAEVMGIKTNKHEHRVSVTDLSDTELQERLAAIAGSDPGVQAALAKAGFKREVETTGAEVTEADSGKER